MTSMGGFEAFAIEDACRAVNLPGSIAETNREFDLAGVVRINSNDIRVQRHP